MTSVPLPAQQKAAPAPEADRAQVLAERHRQEDLVQVRPSALAGTNTEAVTKHGGKVYGFLLLVS